MAQNPNEVPAAVQAAFVALVVGIAPVVVKTMSVMLPAIGTRVKSWSDKKKVESEVIAQMGAEVQRAWNRLDEEREEWELERSALMHRIAQAEEENRVRREKEKALLLEIEELKRRLPVEPEGGASI